MIRIFAATVSAATLLIFLSVNTTAHPPWGIVVDKNGQVYVSDLETIWKIDREGRRSVFRQGVSGRHTHELTMDHAGDLLGEDLSYEPSTQRYTSAIWKMSPAGRFSYVLSPTHDPPKGASIWKDTNGNTYLAQFKDNADPQFFLMKRAPSGKVTTLIGSRKIAEAFRQIILYDVGGMAFGTDGSLFLTDRTNIQKVTMAGEVTTVARNIALGGSNPGTSLMGLTADSLGNVYAADFGGRRIIKIAANGDMDTVLRSEEAWSPTGVAFRNGDLYILEFGNAPGSLRVRKLSSSGKVSVLSAVGNAANPPARQIPVANDTKPIAPPNAFAQNVLIGFCTTVFACGLIILANWQKKGGRK